MLNLCRREGIGENGYLANLANEIAANVIRRADDEKLLFGGPARRVPYRSPGQRRINIQKRVAVGRVVHSGPQMPLAVVDGCASSDVGIAPIGKVRQSALFYAESVRSVATARNAREPADRPGRHLDPGRKGNGSLFIQHAQIVWTAWDTRTR